MGLVIFFTFDSFSWEGGGMVTLSPKIAINLHRTYEKLHCTVRENHIGSVVSDILQYKQTDKHPVTLLYEKVVIIKSD